MFSLCFLLLLSIPALSVHASEPRLLVPAGADGGWTNPVCSPFSPAVAYAAANFDTLYLWPADNKAPLRVAQGEGIGRRFVFESHQERLVYRQVVAAIPTKPERLISTSPYLYDPTVRTSNMDTVIYGPYLIDDRVWFRRSLTEPYRDYRDSLRAAGPYLDLRTGELWVVNATGETVFRSSAPDAYVGMEISPDGEWVAAVTSRPAVGLTVIRIRDGHAQTIPGGAAPAFSGDSRWLVYVAQNAGDVAELHLYAILSGSDVPILRDSRFRPQTPALNADGSRAVFIHDGALFDLTDLH